MSKAKTSLRRVVEQSKHPQDHRYWEDLYMSRDPAPGTGTLPGVLALGVHDKQGSAQARSWHTVHPLGPLRFFTQQRELPGSSRPKVEIGCSGAWSFIQIASKCPL